ncbi:conserved membrane protein of unknown function [Microbacterium sp. Nx66]|uniref:DUF1648 domain-containing protein n=1 Tax=Microbacterium sp. Nx66 TaxID=2766784 RepID=UPI001656DBC5|nr:DUF1648 domain-containing protein [Microbacterium sp. Nx66]CAD5138526.1 conserved membrane protein of unknown function [Microbacterium sp. Nx66]
MTTPDPTRTPPATLRRARRAFVLVASVLPVLIVAISALVLMTWLPSFPADVAIHWGVDGADGFGPATTYLWVLLGVGLGIPVLLTITTLVAVGAHWGATARLLGATAAGMSAFAAVICLGSLAIQRDLPPAGDVPGIAGVMGLAFAALLGVGAMAWFVQPRVRAIPGAALTPRHDVRVGEGERVVWVGTTTMPTGALVFLLLVLLGLVALAVIMVVTRTPMAWVSALVALVVGFALAATTSFRVRVTPDGIDARAVIGWPRRTIPVAEIVSVRAVRISPFGEFGGWGWRLAPDGRSGIVMRQGPAIEVHRRDHGPFVITIDGAEEAAALLQTYVDRSAGPAISGETERAER